MLDDFNAIDYKRLCEVDKKISTHYLADEVFKYLKRASKRYAIKHLNYDPENPRDKCILDADLDTIEKTNLTFATYFALNFEQANIEKYSKKQFVDVCNEVADNLSKSAEFINSIGANFVLLPITLQAACKKELASMLYNYFDNGLLSGLFTDQKDINKNIKSALTIYTRHVRDSKDSRVTDLLELYSIAIRKLPESYPKVALKPNAKRAPLLFFCRKIKQYFMSQYEAPLHDLTALLATIFFGDETNVYNADDVRHMTRGFFEERDKKYHGYVFIEDLT